MIWNTEHLRMMDWLSYSNAFFASIKASYTSANKKPTATEVQLPMSPRLGNEFKPSSPRVCV